MLCWLYSMTIDLELPRDINSIKLSEWQKFSKLVDDNKDSTNDFLEIKMLEIFAGLKYKDIHTLPVGTFSEAIEYLNILFESKTPLIRRFNMTGTDGATVEFGFIPNLDKITMGEYIDLNNYLDDPATLHKAMAVLFRPIHPSYNEKESYRISSYEGSDFFSEIMKDMPLGIALGAKVFFYRLGIKLSKAILNSITVIPEEQEQLSEEERKLLTENIAGIKNCTLLLEDKLLGLTKPHLSQFMKQ